VSTGPRTHTNRTRAQSFGSDARAYDRVRPGYPPELIDDLVADGPRTALDVGCGTGKAARLLQARDVQVLGLEIDPRMAEVARGHGVPVVVTAFETWDARGQSFDLLVSGQAWHWIDPIRGTRRAAALLPPHGLLALFWNFAQLDPAAWRPSTLPTTLSPRRSRRLPCYGATARARCPVISRPCGGATGSAISSGGNIAGNSSMSGTNGSR
jgi:SAM-dependent methyltransferase